MHFDLLVKNGTAVTPMGTEAADIGIRQGRIAAIGALSTASADTIRAASVPIRASFVRDQLEGMAFISNSAWIRLRAVPIQACSGR